MKQPNTKIIQKKKLSFGWYYVWLKLSNIVEPQQDIGTGMRQPDALKGTTGQQPNWRKAGVDCEHCARQGYFWAEYSLIYMIKEFRKKI
eukprot:14994526-Ditylum_brightwellii.AAC.1